MAKRDRPLILCIEDDGDVQALLGMQLGSAYELVFARDGKEGVRQAIFYRPDLILMDLMMPTMDGVEATELIKSVKAVECPLVAVTAAPKNMQEKARAAGCDLVIEKPATDLATRLGPLLARAPGPTE
jgi:two-component system cell cycle response regulator DivK